MPVRLGDLAARVGGRVRGDPERAIGGVATLEAAGPEDLAFFTNTRIAAARRAAVREPFSWGRHGAARRDLLEAPQPIWLWPWRWSSSTRSGDRRLASPPTRAWARGSSRREVSIGPFAVLGARVVLGNGVVVGAGTVLGDDVEILEQTVLAPRVVLYARTRWAPAAGSTPAPFWARTLRFASTAEGHHKIPQVGRVVVEDDVEIGANTTIDSRRARDTVIGRAAS